jgi:hypothetical protein
LKIVVKEFALTSGTLQQIHGEDVLSVLVVVPLEKIVTAQMHH